MCFTRKRCPTDHAKIEREVRERLSKELGYVTPKVGADAALFNIRAQLLGVGLRCRERDVTVRSRARSGRLQ
jgi:hypothetical protein